MARVWIDGRPYEVDASKNLLQVTLEQRIDLPYFCWHPAMGSVGACRQCAVKQYRDEADTRGKIVMACMTPAADGTRIAVDDPEARDFRARVIEWLMVNHPHDCPVCDEGGECHLQDMTVMTGHAYRRFRFPKRTYRNQNLGPFVTHEMNRCIQCYRCVRFYREYAGGRDLDVFGAHDHVYFGRHADGTLESEFAGNLVEVCPTGVFTDKTLSQHYTRKWDLQTAPSVCVHCSLGCNTIPGERYGTLRRIRNRYHDAVNGHFLCDRGRYGYEFVNHERRVRIPLHPHGPDRPADVVTADAALRRLVPLLADRRRLVGIGSPRASLEANFALRTLVGARRFHQGVPATEARLVEAIVETLRRGPARTPSLREVERCDAVLVLGEDAPNTAPVLALSLRQSVRRQPERIAERLGIALWHDEAVREAVQDQRGPLYVATPAPTRLDDLARRTFRGPPEEIARLGFAVAHALDSSAPAVPDLRPEVETLAGEIARALRSAERPLVVTGTGAGSEAVIEAAAAATRALETARGAPPELFCVVPECNSMGLALLGGPPLEEAFRAIEDDPLEAADAVVILENDLYRRADRATVDHFLERARHVIVIDHLAHDTGARADTVLPAGTFAESDGTFVNNEGRAQRFFQVFVPEGEVRESWRWIRDAMRAAGRHEADGWEALDDVLAALAADIPALAGARDAAPPADYRMAGTRIPRMPHRYSGRTAIAAHRNVHERRPPPDPDSPLAFTMEGAELQPPPALIPRFWAPGWNSEASLHRFVEEIEGPLRGGSTGRRLLEPGAPREAPRASIPPPFRRETARWRLLPLHHVFGSEELSVLAPGVAERTPAPYVALHPVDLEALGVAPGDEVAVNLAGAPWRLPVRVERALTPGTAGVPVGLPGLPGGPLPAWTEVKRP